MYRIVPGSNPKITGRSIALGAVGLAIVTAAAIVAPMLADGSPSGDAAGHRNTLPPSPPASSQPAASAGPIAGPAAPPSPAAGRVAGSSAPASSGAPPRGGAASASAVNRQRPTAAARDETRPPDGTPSASAAKPPPIPPPPAKPAPAPVAVSRPGGRPGPANTGVPAGVALTVVNGDVTVTTDGTVIDAKDIKGALTIEASDVKVTRSLIEGSAASDSVVVKSGSNILLQDDEIAVAHPSVSHDAMSVRGVTLNRLNIHGGVDGMKLGSNSTVENSWIHSLSYFSSDPAQGGRPTHNDAIQIMSGRGIRITGNYLQVATSDNAAIQVTQDAGTTTGLVVAGNWADGGGCTFNFSGHGPGGKLLPMSGITVTGNRFGRGMKFAGCAILTDLQTTITQSGNVYDDTGAPIKLQRHN